MEKVKVIFRANIEAKEGQKRPIYVLLPLEFLRRFDNFEGEKPEVLGKRLSSAWGFLSWESNSVSQQEDGCRYITVVCSSSEEEEQLMKKVLKEVEEAKRWIEERSIRKEFKKEIFI